MHGMVTGKYKDKTRGQLPNESQKDVMIDMMKSVGEIASKIIYASCLVFNPFWGNFDLDLST